MLPAFVGFGSEGEVGEGAPFRALGFADEAHVCLLRGPVGFLRVAADAGADDVFPSHRPTAISREDVVEVKVFSVENLAAVLAGVAVALEDVVAGEFDFFAGHPVEKDEEDDAGDADFPAGGLDHLGIRLAVAEVAPTFKVVGGKTAVFRVNDLRLTLA